MTTRAVVNADNSESPRDFKAWDAAEVVHVIRWWLSKTSKRKRLAMAVGGFAEVIQEVYLDLLKHPPRGGFALTTVICKQTHGHCRECVRKFVISRSLANYQMSLDQML